MSNKAGRRQTDYHKLKRKLYWYILLILIVASGFVLLLRSLIQRQGVVGDWIVYFLSHSLRLRPQDAMTVYQHAIRNNMDILVYAAIAGCVLILCWIMLSRFTGYFDEINDGVDLLIRDEAAPITLSAEMEFMEFKLNTLKGELEKRELAAKLAEQRKNDLVMYLAHDLKTPLTSVIGYLSLLREAPEMPVEQKAKYLQITLEKAIRLEGLIDEFFEIARYNLQTITLAKKQIDLYYMLVQMTDEFYPQLAAKGKQATLHAPENLTVFADPDRLARVFNNVLKNAVAYSEDGSVIEITAAVTGAATTVAFRNKGRIPADKLATIFEKFYRLDHARSSAEGVAGLGLAIAKEIIVLHGGQIYAASDENHTTFTVELPTAAANN